MDLELLFTLNAKSILIHHVKEWHVTHLPRSRFTTLSPQVSFNHLDAASIEEQGVEVQILHLGKIEKAKQCVLIGVVRLCTHKTSIDKALDGRGIEVRTQYPFILHLIIFPKLLYLN